MNKLFRPKCMRRMAVFMALVAPIVYLFGSLFFALNGAHGTEVFAEPVYVDQWIDVDSFVADDGNDYRYVVDSHYSDIQTKVASYQSNYNVCWGSYYFNGIECSPTQYGFTLLVYHQAATGLNSLDSYKTAGGYERLVNLDGSQGVAFPWYFSGDVSSLVFISNFMEYGYWQKLVSVPSSVVPENPGAYSDYVFKNFFAKDNFLVQWGENAISENPYGFAPFGYFWRYLDTHVLHMSNEQVGLMAYGYMYYAAHVLLFDVGFILVTFFLTFIQKVADKIGGEDHA